MQMNAFSVLQLLRRMAFAVALAQAIDCVASPTTVVVTGSLQSELGCASDVDPACVKSAFTYDATDGVWQAAFNLPAGNYSYFAALDNSLTVTYGANGKSAFDPISLTLAAPRAVKFYHDDKTHWLTDNVHTPIVTLAGNFQSKLGCGSDFQPDCLRSWLQDIDGDGIDTLQSLLPDGNYSTVVTINESFDEIYGFGGIPNGANIHFSVSGGSVDFCYEGRSHLLSFDATCRGAGPGGTVPEPSMIGLFAAAAAAAILSKGSRRRRPFIKASVWTVPPVTAALCVSEPLPRWWPSSMYFLALSKAPASVHIENATKRPVSGALRSLAYQPSRPRRLNPPASRLPLAQTPNRDQISGAS